MQPRKVSVVFAARAALRVLPVMQEARSGGFGDDFFAGIVLPVFRASAVAFANADDPRNARDYARTAGVAASTVAFYNVPVRAEAILANSAAAAARASAHAARSAFPAYAVAHASDCVENAAYAYTAAAPGAAVAHVTFWSALSADATHLEKGKTTHDIAELPLWPQGQPQPLQSLWREMKATLHAEGQDWHVWTLWYDIRLAGGVRDEKCELAYVRIEEALWDQGPAIVNAEIKRRIEKHKPPRRRKKEPEPFPPELRPPEAPLPPPSPATRFVVQQGIVDVVPPTAWAGREAQVATYHARARAIALRFSDKLANTDAEPELAASVLVVVDVLGDDPSQLQPDQLRLASRTIASKARAYGHPSARGELGVESVSALFELADVLVSLQALASQELEEHERAIRALDLTEASVAEVKEGLDLVAEAIAVAPEIVSELASFPFEASVTASDNAADKTVQITIEGDRILLTENLILALARALAEPGVPVNITPPTITVGEAVSPSANEIVQKGLPKQRKKSKPRKQPKTTRGRAIREVPNEQSWEDLKGRFIAHLKAKAPEALAGATLEAATSAIKHLPKTIPVLAGLVYAAIVGAPALLAAGSGLSVSLAWIGYELLKRKKPPI